MDDAGPGEAMTVPLLRSCGSEGTLGLYRKSPLMKGLTKAALFLYLLVLGLHIELYLAGRAGGVCDELFCGHWSLCPGWATR